MITNILTAMPITAGQSVTDSATLFGANVASAAGTVTYKLFSGSICKGKALQSHPVTVTGGSIPSTTFTINTVGSYSLKASYSGDALNGASSTKCESPLTVIKASPTVSTMLSANPITAAQSVTDSATLSGASPTAHGTMTYDVFMTACSGTPVSVSTTSVINGVAQPSKPFSHSPGTYYFQAVYSGDQNNNAAASSCSEVLTINGANAAISTTLSQTTIVAGQSVTDSATLTGATSNAGGTVTYYYCAAPTCTSGGTQVGSAVTVVNGVVPNSASQTFNAIGTYSWRAHYSGDVNNNAADATSEGPLTVNMASPSVSTQLSANPITATGSVFDTATLTASSGSNAGGTITVLMYTTSSTCSGSSVSSGALTVTNNMVTAGPFFAPNQAAGTYSFQASYSGDSNNNPKTSSCEVLNVKPAAVSISTALSSTTINTGAKVDDFATLTGFTTNAAGSITFTLYLGSSCSGTLLDHFTTPVTAGVENSAYVSPTFNAGGPYSVIAVYSGDTNNAGATSACELLTVMAQPTISTALSAGPITDAQSVYDTATLSLATSTAGGTVTYQLFPASGCAGLPSDTSQVTVTNALVPNSKSFGGLEFTPPGAYSFNAVYSGDSFNAGTTSSCEGLTVSMATPSISISLSTMTIVHGNSVIVYATLTGATSNAGGTVTYRLENAAACGGSQVGISAVAVTNGVVPSAMFTIASAGTYSIYVTYSGDSNNNAASPTCSSSITVT